MIAFCSGYLPQTMEEIVRCRHHGRRTGGARALEPADPKRNRDVDQIRNDPSQPSSTVRRLRPVLQCGETVPDGGDPRLDFLCDDGAVDVDVLRSPLPTEPVAALEPFRIANRYGLFGIMTRGRYEIEFQGSDDGKNWVAYPFRYKPQDLSQPPGIYAPYQPRFDWNLWFASLGSWQEYPIVPKTEVLLLSNDSDVLNLFATNPFPEWAATPGTRCDLAILVYDHVGKTGLKAYGGAVNSWDCMLRRSSANPMGKSMAWNGLRLLHASECRHQFARILACFETSCQTAWTAPFSPHDSHTCHALLRPAEWTLSKYRYRAPTWRNGAKSVETATDECPWLLHRYRLPPGWRPCSQDRRERRHDAPECSRGNPEQSAQFDPPVLPACLLGTRSAHDSKPRPCVCRLEPASYRKD